MNTLIKKEIRLLLPAWITAMLLAIFPRVFIIIYTQIYPGDSVYYRGPLPFFTELIFTAGVLYLGINSFGQELSGNTFSVMLSQPMKRPRIWLIKVATLAAAFISVWLAAVYFASWQFGVLDRWYSPGFSVIFHSSVPGGRYGLQEFSIAFEFMTLSALLAFSGGLWTTLLLRQITGAFWFTLLTPLAIILGICAVFQDWIVTGRSFGTFIVDALVLYSVAGFSLAWRLFMRAQDVQSTGGEISLPIRKRIPKIRAGSLAIRPRHRFLALTWKELQLYQGTFLIAAIILVLHVTAFFIRKFHPHILNPNIASSLEAIGILWLLMPLLIGAAAIAEERRMGTFQLCLPVSRGAQLFVKFCVALVLSLVFGALAPVLIEGTKIFDPWYWFFVVAAAIFYTSFYASSLGHTTLQSIGWAILVALAICTEVLRISYYANPELERLTRYLVAVILTIVLGWLTFSNFKQEHQNRKFWMRNLLAVFAVFACVPVLAASICFLRELARRGIL